VAGRTRNAKLGPAVEMRTRVPGPLFDAATAEAEARDISVAEFVRQLLARELGVHVPRVGEEPAA
jgi:hypothetical protein